MPTKVVDLRKLLGATPDWDELNWDGFSLAVTRRQRLADAKVHVQLEKILEGLGPISAVRESYRKVIIYQVTAASALEGIVKMHAVVAALAVEAALNRQPQKVLEEYATRASAEVAQRVDQILTQRGRRLHADLGDLVLEDQEKS